MGPLNEDQQKMFEEHQRRQMEMYEREMIMR